MKKYARHGNEQVVFCYILQIYCQPFTTAGQKANQFRLWPDTSAGMRDSPVVCYAVANHAVYNSILYARIKKTLFYII